MNISPIKIWILAARPKTLWAGIAPVMIGTALAWEDGLFYAPAAFAALLGSLLIQIGTNFANDYFDFVKGTDTEDRVGPLRATQAGLVTPRQMRRATLLAFSAAVLVGLYLVYRGGWPILLIGVLSILCGILYTGGPWPLGYLGLGDLFVLIFYGPVAVAGTYYVQGRHADALPIIAGLAPGFFSVAILTVNNLRDLAGDRLSGKKTLAVRFGPRFARLEYLFSLLIASTLIPLYLCLIHQDHWWALASMLTLIPACTALREVFGAAQNAALNTTLARTGKLLLLFSLLFSLGWIL